MDESMGERIKKLRKEADMTQEDLADLLGVQKSAIAKYESGRVSNIKRSAIKKMAQRFQVSLSYLMGFDDGSAPLPSNIITPSAYRVPILGTICAGDGIVIDQSYQGSIITDKRIDADYALFVKGDSMKGAGIYDGNLVYIKKFSDYEDGLIYAVGIRGEEEAVIRRVYRQDDSSALLVPCNEDFSPRLLGQDRFFLIGKVIGVYRKI